MDTNKDETQKLLLVYEALLDVGPKWYNIGLFLGVSLAELDCIKDQFKNDDPKVRLREALRRWLQISPLSWKTVVDTLRNKAVGEERLAKELETKYHIDCATGTTNSDGGEMGASDKPLTPPTDADVTHRVTSPVPGQSKAPKMSAQSSLSMPRNDSHDKTESGLDGLVKECAMKITRLETKFRELVAKSEEVVSDVPVQKFCSKVTLLPLGLKQTHSEYLEKKIPAFTSAKSINELFCRFNLYWDYLNYTLLQHIIETYGDDDTKRKMQEYVDDVTSFRKETLLRVFWKVCTPKHMETPDELRAILSTHKNFHSDSTLEEVEQFRCEFAENYSLPNFTLILRQIKNGSVIITWFLPETFELSEQVKGGGTFLEEHQVDSLAWVIEPLFKQKIRSLIKKQSQG